MFVLNTLCITYFMTSSVAMFEAAMWVKSMYNKIVMTKRRKRKYGNRQNLYISLHLKKDFGMEFTAC